MHAALNKHLEVFIEGFIHPELFIKETKYMYCKYLEFPHHFSGHLGVGDCSAIH